MIFKLLPKLKIIIIKFLPTSKRGVNKVIKLEQYLQSFVFLIEALLKSNKISMKLPSFQPHIIDMNFFISLSVLNNMFAQA